MMEWLMTMNMRPAHWRQELPDQAALLATHAGMQGEVGCVGQAPKWKHVLHLANVSDFSQFSCGTCGDALVGMV